MGRASGALVGFGLVSAMLMLSLCSLGCPRSPTETQTDNTTPSNSPTIDLKITGNNLSILKGLEKKSEAYDTVADSRTSYRKLFWSVDSRECGESLDVPVESKKQYDSNHTQLTDYEGSADFWGECVSAVKALSHSTVPAGGTSWIKGDNVMGDRHVLEGTVIATFTANNGTEFDPSGKSGAGGHTAIFKGYVKNGIEVWDQNWEFQRVFGKHCISTAGSGVSDADSYYVVQIANPTYTSIKYGQEVTGSIAKSGDYQDWKFAGAAGDIITIRMFQDAGVSLHPGVELLDSSGSQVKFAYSESEARIANYTLLFSGIYTIRASGNWSSVGGFKLSLAKKPATPTIAYGDEVTGQNVFDGDYQDWKFAGTAGDVITIRMFQDGGVSLHPGVQLLDPSASQVKDAYSESEARIANYMLLFSGIYTIRASGNWFSVGGFKLSLAKKPDTPTIAYGDEVTGQIVFDGDYQDWKFAGTAGDTVTIRMIQDGGVSLHPGVELFDSSASQVKYEYSEHEACIANYTLLFSGTYTIRASGAWFSVGGFKLSLNRN